MQPDRETKSVGAEDTFAYDLTTIEEMNPELEKIAVVVCERLLRHGLKGRTITLKIKYSDFKLITRSRSLTQPTNENTLITETSKQLLLSTDPTGKKIRLLGISLSNFNEPHIPGHKKDSGQLSLF